MKKIITHTISLACAILLVDGGDVASPYMTPPTKLVVGPRKPT